LKHNEATAEHSGLERRNPHDLYGGIDRKETNDFISITSLTQQIQ